MSSEPEIVLVKHDRETDNPYDSDDLESECSGETIVFRSHTSENTSSSQIQHQQLLLPHQLQALTNNCYDPNNASVDNHPHQVIIENHDNHTSGILNLDLRNNVLNDGIIYCREPVVMATATMTDETGVSQQTTTGDCEQGVTTNDWLEIHRLIHELIQITLSLEPAVLNNFRVILKHAEDMLKAYRELHESRNRGVN